MAKKRFGRAPFRVCTLDSDGLITRGELVGLLDDNEGSVTLCLRSAAGHGRRGGYFFHLKRTANPEEIELYDFGRTLIGAYDLDTMVSFVNHASGRRFDEKMLAKCLTEINFRSEEEQDETSA